MSAIEEMEAFKDLIYDILGEIHSGQSKLPTSDSKRDRKASGTGNGNIEFEFLLKPLLPAAPLSKWFVEFSLRGSINDRLYNFDALYEFFALCNPKPDRIAT